MGLAMVAVQVLALAMVIVMIIKEKRRDGYEERKRVAGNGDDCKEMVERKRDGLRREENDVVAAADDHKRG